MFSQPSVTAEGGKRPPNHSSHVFNLPSVPPDDDLVTELMDTDGDEERQSNIEACHQLLGDAQHTLETIHQVSQTRGAPQGSPLSPILFCLASQFLIKNCTFCNDLTLYADDFTAVIKESNYLTAINKLAELLEYLNSTLPQMGLSLNPQKTQFIFKSRSVEGNDGSATFIMHFLI
ncbi:hypothetical protein ACOME3_010151 [Neoechinorhynchus agilis]